MGEKEREISIQVEEQLLLLFFFLVAENGEKLNRILLSSLPSSSSFLPSVPSEYMYNNHNNNKKYKNKNKNSNTYNNNNNNKVVTLILEELEEYLMGRKQREKRKERKEREEEDERKGEEICCLGSSLLRVQVEKSLPLLAYLSSFLSILQLTERYVKGKQEEEHQEEN